MITILTFNRYKNVRSTIFYLIKFIFIFFKRKFFYDFENFLVEIKYSGHPQVVKSFIDGFNKLNIKYNINPVEKRNFYPNVLVLSGIEQLEYAIALKKNNFIKKVFAGPNIVLFPSNYKDIFIKPEIDYVITPSRWVSQYYIEDLKILKNKIKEIPSGIDTKYWQPNRGSSKFVLIYVKEHNINFNFDTKKYINYLKKSNIKFKILKYGTYNNKKFKNLLQKSKISVFFSISESQGMALLKSWSMGVPTLVYYNNEVIIQNKKIACETAPYLTSSTGLYFKNFNEFIDKFNYINDNYQNYNPNLWVRDNMTDEKCAKTVVKLFRGNQT